MAKARCEECEKKCGKDKADMNTIKALEAAYTSFKSAASESLLKKYLTQDIFDKMKTRKTSFGSTLLDCVQSGFANPDSGVGIYAPDPEAYEVFKAIFNPIIQDYHLGFKKNDKHPPTDFGDVNAFTNVDPSGKYVISTRVRCGRSVDGYPFNPCLNEAQYVELEKKITDALKSLIGEIKVTYYPLKGMSSQVQQQLTDDHFLFKEGDRFLQAANASRFWPTGRGIFHNSKKTFLVWLNEEDHIRIISMQPGGDLGEVYRRFVKAVTEIEKKVKFSRSDRLGYLTFCPTNLGTAIRASVHIKVPNLASNMDNFKKLADKYSLQIRGTSGEHTEAKGGIYDISNKRRLGLTEYEAIKEMQDGILEIIKQEQQAKPLTKKTQQTNETEED